MPGSSMQAQFSPQTAALFNEMFATPESQPDGGAGNCVPQPSAADGCLTWKPYEDAPVSGQTNAVPSGASEKPSGHQPDDPARTTKGADCANNWKVRRWPA